MALRVPERPSRLKNTLMLIPIIPLTQIPFNPGTGSNTRFVTFHPSFAYEDFIEGLRRKVDDEGCIHYQVEDGVFKEFARRHSMSFFIQQELKKNG